MTTAVQVRTPCRLHFGMFGFGCADRAQFGGVGAMIEPPCLEVKISPADRFAVHGALTDRARLVVELLVNRWKLPMLPACEVAVHSPRDHTGLGVGTQLNLAIATGLRRFLDLPDISLPELAATVGRGSRSAVGTYGFQLGGLVVDAGKEAGQTLGKLATRVALPDAWRFVLFCQSDECGLAGPSEATAFERLAAVPAHVTRELWAITNDEILPSVEQADCRKFGEAVYRFGRLAGECFAAVQNGPFASREIEQLVDCIRNFGVPGAGQSSWGPTVFAVTDGDEEARRLIEWIREQSNGVEYDYSIARPNNCGAALEG
jgi:beta-ribofuranosylaminobenzene 5'-phosphate synthase